MYRDAVVQFEGSDDNSFFADGAYLPVILAGGLLSDELDVLTLGGSELAYQDQKQPGDFAIDARTIPEQTTRAATSPGGDAQSSTTYANSYFALQRLRGVAAQGIGALTEYAPADSALVGHLAALMGYAELFLADLYCSGVPLSTLDYGADYTYQAGSSTSDIYAHALTWFDRALALAADSARILNLARVGKGRALVALGQYAAAGHAVEAVPDNFQYTISVNWDGRGANPVAGRSLLADRQLSVADREGGTGLAYRSRGDPRTAADSTGVNPFLMPVFFPRKYTDGAGTAIRAAVPMASGVEARLIQAEAALHTAGDWLGILNRLRQQFAPPPIATQQLVDPGNFEARVDTLFAERAAWLFLTGQRQGDLRRLVREYGRDPDAVYPTGAYPAVFGSYGPDVNLPVPPEERVNPHFGGCFGRGA